MKMYQLNKLWCFTLALLNCLCCVCTGNRATGYYKLLAQEHQAFCHKLVFQWLNAECTVQAGEDFGSWTKIWSSTNFSNALIQFQTLHYRTILMPADIVGVDCILFILWNLCSFHQVMGILPIFISSTVRGSVIIPLVRTVNTCL